MRTWMFSHRGARVCRSRSAPALSVALLAASLYGLAGAGPAAAQSYENLNEAVNELAGDSRVDASACG